MKYEVVLSKQAEMDLRRIVEYLTIDCSSEKSASKLFNRLTNHISSLSYFPYRYPVIKDKFWSKKGLHQMSVANYIIAYIPDDSTLTITIIRISYHTRNLNDHWSRI